jgi:hypothetical protein
MESRRSGRDKFRADDGSALGRPPDGPRRLDGEQPGAGLETGEWPSEPLVVGWTAADLGRLYRPSLVLTSLLWLKRDPEAAKASLKHAFADPEVPYTPDLTTDPVAAGFFSRRKPASEKS